MCWNSIEITTSNALIGQFQDRLEVCRLTSGECVNENRDLLQVVHSAPDKVPQFMQHKAYVKASLDHFMSTSDQFFNWIKETQVTGEDWSLYEAQTSQQICSLLPEEARQRTGLPLSLTKS